MTTEEIRTALLKYKRLIYPSSMTPYQFASNAFVGESTTQRTRVLQHLRWMIDQAVGFLTEADDAIDGARGDVLAHRKLREKAMRWLCFIQGTLWTLGSMTIDEMKADNKGPVAAETPTKEL